MKPSEILKQFVHGPNLPQVSAEQIKLLDDMADEIEAARGDLDEEEIAVGAAIRSLLASYLISLAEAARLSTRLDKFETLLSICPHCDQYQLDPELECHCAAKADGSDL